MKKYFIILFAAMAVIWTMIAGCEIINNGETMVDSKGLSLYWAHRVFHEEGRGYVFEFYEAQRSDMLYDLKFDYRIDNGQKNIEISLVDKINRGKCPLFPTPTPNDDGLCTSKGGFYIPEDKINEGEYGFTVKTGNYTIQSEIVFTKEKATLNIPGNDYFSSAIQEVFVAPKNLLSGGIVFTGEENKASALDFIDELRSLGLKDTVVTNPPLIKVDEKGSPVIESWPPDKFSIPFLLTLTVDFSTIFELAKIHFNKSNINIYLSSTNGDEARLDFQGVWYSE